MSRQYNHATRECLNKTGQEYIDELNAAEAAERKTAIEDNRRNGRECIPTEEAKITSAYIDVSGEIVLYEGAPEIQIITKDAIFGVMTQEEMLQRMQDTNKSIYHNYNNHHCVLIQFARRDSPKEVPGQSLF